MRAQNHTFIFDRSTGRYRDTGPSSSIDRVFSWFSAGQIRVAPPAQQQSQPSADKPQRVDPYPSGFDR